MLVQPLARFLRGSKSTVQCKVLCESTKDANVPTDLKRELISQQVTYEISELASTTALQRFGAPFRSEYGEVAPVDSDLPILRYIFVHHVRNFPFLDQAREKEFWQDKLQVVWYTLGSKRANAGLGLTWRSFWNHSQASTSHPRKTASKKRNGES